MKRLIFDAQVFQTPAWHRGMGKYSLELIRSITNDNKRAHTWKEFVVILSKQIPVADELKKELESIEDLRIEMLDLVPNDILNPLVSAETNRKVVDGFIGDGEDDSFLILSLMQGEISPVFPSSDKVHRSVLFYDLIPFMFHGIYLKNPITRKEYLTKIGELIQADSFLAISKTVANDLAIYLGIPPAMIVSIDGGPIQHDTKEESFSVSGKFILMPTGNDLRKNNRRAIEAFEMFNRQHENEYTLVITSFFKPEEITDLQSLSNHVIFTGNISGAQLNFLYRAADLVLFPSEYEGLGLPVLEALEHGTPVACSDISVFREISLTAFTYFDPTRIQSIANAIEVGVNSRVSKVEAKTILSRYDWKNTAIAARVRLNHIPVRQPRSAIGLRIISPDVSSPEGRVGKFITQLHACLQTRFFTTYYQEVYEGNVEHRVNIFRYIASFEQMSKTGPIFDQEPGMVACYHIANTPSYIRIMLGALAKPGILILHDLELSKLWRTLFDEGLISEERYKLEKLLDKKYKSKGLVSLLAISQGVVVFSKQAEEMIRSIASKIGTDIKITTIFLPTNGLVYDEVAPLMKSHRLSLDEIRTLDDMHYEIAISYSSGLTINSNASDTDTLLTKAEMDKYNPKNAEYDDYKVFVDKFEAFIESVYERENA